MHTLNITTRFFISFIFLFGFALGQAQTQITLPYTESFKDGLGNFTRTTSSSFTWTRHSGTTPSGDTGPRAAADGTYYMYTEASNHNSGAVADLLLAPFEINSIITSAGVKFRYHMKNTVAFSSHTFGSLALQVQESDDTWTTLWSRSENQGDHWLTAVVDISSYLGSPIHLRFHRVRGTSNSSDAAIDDFQIVTSPPVIALLGDITYFSLSTTCCWNICFLRSLHC